MTSEEAYYQPQEEEERGEEEEEIIIDIPTSTDEPIIDETSKKMDFQECINNFRTFVPDIEIISDPNGGIQFSIASSLIPVALRAAFGFLDSDILLNFDIFLDDYNWRKKPIKCIISNPTNFNYCGRYLVERMITNFFSAGYRKKDSYRCAPIFLRDQRDSDSTIVHSIENNGFSHMQAVRAASLCDNDLNQSLTFLQTGQYQLNKPFEIIVSYPSCPLLYFILEIFDLILNIQDHCAICGAAVKPALIPRPCFRAVCVNDFYEKGIGTTLLKHLEKDVYAADLIVSVLRTALETEYFYPKPSFPGKSKDGETKDMIGISLFTEIVKTMPAIKELLNYSGEIELKEKVGIKMFHVLRWIFLTCKTKLYFLPPKFAFPILDNKRTKKRCYQFMTLPGSAEQESIFTQLKNKYGSRLLFFGAPTERWYSIFRNGLMNLNVAQLLPPDSIHDDGIYLTEKSKIALAFAHDLPNSYTATEFNDKSLQIIAVCEVINLPSKEVTFDAVINGENPSTKQIKTLKGSLVDHKWCLTLTMNEACIVRLLLVNFNGDININNCNLIIPNYNYVAQIQSK